MSIRTLIVDDEHWARTRIQSLLASEKDFEIVRACESGDEAVHAIASLAPQVVFLDVQMPGLDGFGVIDAVGAEAMPLVVFATAYDQYTLKAFDAHAFDYLLKPIDPDRFQRALARVRKEILVGGSRAAALRSLLGSRSSEQRYLQRVVVRSAGKVILLKAVDIDWLEGSGNYVTLHIGRSTYLLRESLNALERKLDPDQFVRSHRSAIVNVDRIRELGPWSGGEQALVLLDGTQLTIGRVFRARLENFLSNTVD
jgi:two-component system, LytTR family, response regulator